MYKVGDKVFLYDDYSNMGISGVYQEYILIEPPNNFCHRWIANDISDNKKPKTNWYIHEKDFRLAKNLNKLDQEIYDLETIGYRDES